MSDRDTQATGTPSTGHPQQRLPEWAIPYWQKVLSGMETAQQEMSRAQQLEAEAQQLRVQATARVGAYESYAAHLTEALGLDLDRDRIDRDGTLSRVPGSGPSPDPAMTARANGTS